MEVAVGSEVSHFVAVLDRIGRGDHKYWRMAALPAVAHMAQHLPTRLLRKIDIQDYQSRAGCALGAVDSVEKLDRRFAVFYDVQIGANTAGGERFANQIYVRSVVFDDQDLTAQGRGRFLRRGR